MNSDLSAYQFKQVYVDLGYDLSKLGCIMLPLVSNDDLETAVTKTISHEDTYFASNPSRSWIKGIVADKAHITLLYGLLRSGQEMEKHVDAVLEYGVKMPNEVKIDHVGYFVSPYADEPYYCIVAHLAAADGLVEAHDRLTFLPHIDTFPDYEAHITLAYIKKDEAKRDEYVKRLNKALSGLLLTAANELDYGSDEK
jgi:hypothetical protein